jgi:hypothetical protein
MQCRRLTDEIQILHFSQNHVNRQIERVKQDDIKVREWIILAHEDPMLGSLVHGNKPSGFTKYKGFLD